MAIFKSTRAVAESGTNILIALVLTGLLLLALGIPPLKGLWILLSGGLGTLHDLAYTLFMMTNLIFVGLAVAVAFQTGLFNIGVDGQVLMGGLFLSFVVLALDHSLPGWLILPLAVIVGCLASAAYAAIPGFLKVRFRSHEVITTIMLNYVAYGILNYAVVDLLEDKGMGIAQSRLFQAGLIASIPGMAPLNWTFVAAIIVAILLDVFLFRTRLGFDFRVLGKNERAAIYAGVNPGSVLILSMAISGMLGAGMAINDLLGFSHRLTPEFTVGLGFTGIAVSLVARNRPLGVIATAFFFALLYQGGITLSFAYPSVSNRMTVVIESFVLLSLGLLSYALSRWFGLLHDTYLRRRRK